MLTKHATRFQFAIYLQQGYNLVCWNPDEDRWGMYLKSLNYVNRFKTRLAASGTKAELDALIEEYTK